MMKKSIDSFNKVLASSRLSLVKVMDFIKMALTLIIKTFHTLVLMALCCYFEDQMMPMIKETPFNDKTQNDTILKSWIDDGFMPLIYKGEMMDLSRGRAISREKMKPVTQHLQQ